jgi:hypothetical protein
MNADDVGENSGRNRADVILDFLNLYLGSDRGGRGCDFHLGFPRDEFSNATLSTARIETEFRRRRVTSKVAIDTFPPSCFFHSFTHLAHGHGRGILKSAVEARPRRHFQMLK